MDKTIFPTARAGMLLILAFFSNPSKAEENPLFFHTHLLPSPYTVQAGYLSYGTTIAYGITDQVQVSTNVLKDFYQIYNVDVKLALADYQDFATALTLGYETFNYKNISSSNPDLSVSSVKPGFIVAISVSDPVAIYFGGSWSVSQTRFLGSGVEISGLLHGILTQTDIAWRYQDIDENGHANVLAAGATYDVVYKTFGVGLSHHWPGFHLGAHYYPNATEGKIQPILTGGGGIQF